MKVFNEQQTYNNTQLNKRGELRVLFSLFLLMHQPGDIINVEATGVFAPGIECIVMEVHPEDGRIIKMKAAIPDEQLAKVGFLIEGEDWVVFEWHYSPN